MKIFISYARVDKPYALKIAQMLSTQSIWLDDRLYMGDKWWNSILQHLDWCNAFLFILSPDSVNSRYCWREFLIAQRLGRRIFPVLINADTQIPDELLAFQYVDFSEGMTSDAVSVLHNSIHAADVEVMNAATAKINSKKPMPAQQVAQTVDSPVPNLFADAMTMLSDAIENENHDVAVMILEQLLARPEQPKHMNLKNLLQMEREALEKQMRNSTLDVEYAGIAVMVKRPRTHLFGCGAFEDFHQAHPDYDPDNLANLCKVSIALNGANAAPSLIMNYQLPLLEWLDVPEGKIILPESDASNGNGHSPTEHATLTVPAFKMARYPVTHAQYQVFLKDEQGYVNPRWWEFSAYARESRRKNPVPPIRAFPGENHPREMISWYDAMAFCAWLSDKLGVLVTLPSRQQWIRAARLDFDWCYPWGGTFDPSLANTSESQIRMTTDVTRYPKGRSPVEAMDMVGNVWEWCLNGKMDEQETSSDKKRYLCGGSWFGGMEKAQIPYALSLIPQTQWKTIGFRPVIRVVDDGGQV